MPCWVNVQELPRCASIPAGGAHHAIPIRAAPYRAALLQPYAQLPDVVGFGDTA